MGEPTSFRRTASASLQLRWSKKLTLCTPKGGLYRRVRMNESWGRRKYRESRQAGRRLSDERRTSRMEA